MCEHPPVATCLDCGLATLSLLATPIWMQLQKNANVSTLAATIMAFAVTAHNLQPNAQLTDLLIEPAYKH